MQEYYGLAVIFSIIFIVLTNSHHADSKAVPDKPDSVISKILRLKKFNSTPLVVLVDNNDDNFKKEAQISVKLFDILPPKKLSETVTGDEDELIIDKNIPIEEHVILRTHKPPRASLGEPFSILKNFFGIKPKVVHLKEKGRRYKFKDTLPEILKNLEEDLEDLDTPTNDLKEALQMKINNVRPSMFSKNGKYRVYNQKFHLPHAFKKKESKNNKPKCKKVASCKNKCTLKALHCQGKCEGVYDKEDECDENKEEIEIEEDERTLNYLKEDKVNMRMKLSTQVNPNISSSTTIANSSGDCEPSCEETTTTTRRSRGTGRTMPPYWLLRALKQ